METQTLLAHLPMLFHSDAKQVMVLGLGSGITAGEVLNYPIERMDILEISKEVVEASRFFRPWNGNVLEDARTHLIIQDGRAHLQLTDRTYDVIISEPSNPWMAGLATLFTREFFALARDKLTSDGILVQWLHAYSIDWPTFSLVGRTFAEVFPHSALVVTDPLTPGADLLLVGFKGKDVLSFENAQRNLPSAQKSRNVTLANPDVLYSLVMSENLAKVFGEGPVNSDAHPRLEFAAPRVFYTADSEDSEIARNVQKGASLPADVIRRARRVRAEVDGQIDLAAYAFSLHWPFPGMVDLAKATPAQRQRFQQLAEAYAADHWLSFGILGDKQIERSCRIAQIRALEGRMDSVPDKAAAYLHMAELYSDLNRVGQAVVCYRKALESNPDSPTALGSLALRLAMYKEADFHNPQEAVVLAEKACAISQSKSAWLMDALAIAYAATGQYDKAQDAANKSLQLYSSASSKQPDRIKAVEARLRLYAAGQPYRESLPEP